MDQPYGIIFKIKPENSQKSHPMQMLLSTLLLLVTLVLTTVNGVSNIPNGDNIVNPCKPTEGWPEVGNQDPSGSGTLNRFGQDLSNNNNTWTLKLCQMDSDFDGLSNGAELGDPACVWTPGSQPARTTTLSHPGLCDPITSPKCQGINSWLSCAAYKCPSFNLTTTHTQDLIFPLTSRVPQQDAAYICKGFKLTADLSYHIVGTTPIIDKPSIIQQMVLFGCDKPMSGANVMKFSTPCSMGVDYCRTPIAIWDVGSPGQCHAEQFGFPMGINGYQYVVLQLHWKNPTKSRTLLEHSGMTVYYTSELRPNTGQIVMVGQQDIQIPQSLPNAFYTGSCVKGCTRLFTSSLYIAEAFLHMHQQGKSGSVDLIKDGVVTNLITESNYNYNVPKLLTLDSSIEFRAGDELRVNCFFQTLNKNDTTHYGFPAADEMCFGFITVYPAIKGFDRCSQWRDLPHCPLSDALTYSNCNLVVFPTYFAPILQYCDGNCSDVCQSMITGILATRCLDGNLGAWLTTFQSITYPNLPSVLALIQTCRPVTSTTSSPTATSSASSVYVAMFREGIPNGNLASSVVFSVIMLMINKTVNI